MRRIRVLIIDDSVVIRRLLTDALAADPSIEVVGVAANGKIGLAKIPQVNPDAVTLDIEMPEMDGLTTVREIRKVWPKLPVIMFSTLCERGAAATMEALSRGASDYVTKPANVGSVAEATRRITTDLSAKLKVLCGGGDAASGAKGVATGANGTATVGERTASDTNGLQRAATVRERPVFPVAVSSPGSVRPRLLAIGSSTGGPVALSTVMGALNANLGVPVVITQHMPPMFTKLLADRLNTGGPLKASEAKHGDVLEPNHAYVAPGDHHMRVVRGGNGTLKLTLDQGPPENSCRPAVDVMFRSAVEAVGGNVLGVVLTGMGQDGMLGARHIVAAGGKVLAQDEASSVVWGMPGAVVRDGTADAVLPLNQVAAEINRRLASVPAFAPRVDALLRKGA